MDSDSLTYPPLETLKPVAEDVWIVDGPTIPFRPPGLKIRHPTRMTSGLPRFHPSKSRSSETMGPARSTGQDRPRFQGSRLRAESHLSAAGNRLCDGTPGGARPERGRAHLCQDHEAPGQQFETFAGQPLVVVDGSKPNRFAWTTEIAPPPRWRSQRRAQEIGSRSGSRSANTAGRGPSPTTPCASRPRLDRCSRSTPDTGAT
jgi:hypothetical protein